MSCAQSSASFDATLAISRLHLNGDCWPWLDSFIVQEVFIAWNHQGTDTPHDPHIAVRKSAVKFTQSFVIVRFEIISDPILPQLNKVRQLT
jgi:hypothetical protein